MTWRDKLYKGVSLWGTEELSYLSKGSELESDGAKIRT